MLPQLTALPSMTNQIFLSHRELHILELYPDSTDDDFMSKKHCNKVELSKADQNLTTFTTIEHFCVHVPTFCCLVYRYYFHLKSDEASLKPQMCFAWVSFIAKNICYHPFSISSSFELFYISLSIQILLQNSILAHFPFLSN